MNQIEKIIIISFYSMEYVEYSIDNYGAKYYFQHNISITRADGKRYIAEYAQSRRLRPSENKNTAVVMKSNNSNNLPAFYYISSNLLLSVVYIRAHIYNSPLKIDVNIDFYLHLSIYTNYTNANSKDLMMHDNYER